MRDEFKNTKHKQGCTKHVTVRRARPMNCPDGYPELLVDVLFSRNPCLLEVDSVKNLYIALIVK